jgi:N-acetylglutamate synthase-like GNAT family acetyltransferase
LVAPLTAAMELIIQPGTFSSMEIRKLNSQDIDTIANWFNEEWGHLSNDFSKENSIKQMNVRVNSNQIPLTIVAEEKNIVGTASLVETDLDLHNELSPWLATVFVSEEYRKQGVGQQLCLDMLNKARELGFKNCYLFTPSKEEWYLKQGWETIFKESYRGDQIVVMKFEL